MCCNNNSSISLEEVEYTSIRYSGEVSRGNFSRITKNDLFKFEEILSKDGVSTEFERVQTHNVDCYGMVKGQSKVLLMPKTTSEVSEILKYCNMRHLALTPQGGNTGLVAGGVPVFDEIILSMARMNRILEFHELSGVLKAESGATLKALNEYAGARGFIVPLDLAPDEHCQIGGNVATNAGGLRYFRYGSLHATVLGLEFVLADGEIVDLMGCMKKDNTGYDIKQLMIGSEGTLGIITKVAIQCPIKPNSMACLLLGLPSFNTLTQAFELANRYFQEALTCCEFMDKEAMSCVKQNLNLENPLEDADSKYFLLLECSKKEEGIELEVILQGYLKSFEDSGNSFIALDKESITKLWGLRRGIGSAVLRDGYAYKYDFSIPLDRFHDFLEEVKKRVGPAVVRCCSFGHVGDSNIHLVVTTETYDPSVTTLLEPFLYNWEVFISAIQHPLRTHITHIFESVGVSIGKELQPEEPWNVYLKDDSNKFFIRIAISPFLGIGETYVENLWNTKDLKGLLCRVLHSLIGEMCGHWFHKRQNQLTSYYIRLNASESEMKIGAFFDKHFDFLSAILDPVTSRFSYGHWDSLCVEDELTGESKIADERRLQVITARLEMEPGKKVLVLGCHWGTLPHHLATVNGVRVTAVTFGDKSTEAVRLKCHHLPNVEIRQSYDGNFSKILASEDEFFDGIVSVEPFRWMQRSRQKRFFDLLSKKLVKGGKLLLETCGNMDARYPFDDLFSHRFLFCNAHFPTAKEILTNTESKWNLQAWTNSSANYYKTISHWRKNLSEPQLRLEDFGYCERDLRSWNFSFALLEAGFITEKLQSWEILFTKFPNVV